MAGNSYPLVNYRAGIPLLPSLDMTVTATLLTLVPVLGFLQPLVNMLFYKVLRVHACCRRMATIITDYGYNQSLSDLGLKHLTEPLPSLLSMTGIEDISEPSPTRLMTVELCCNVGGREWVKLYTGHQPFYILSLAR